MDKYNKLVGYLEDTDFTKDGKLIAGQGKPAIVMVWASWCPHCKNMKQAFADAAEKLQGKALFACAQQDGDKDSEKRAVQIISGRYGVKGFPTILKFDASGKFVETYKGDRSTNSLIAFL